MDHIPTQTQIDAMNFQMLPNDARWDERILHFLKEIPAWLIILIAVAILIFVWMRTASEDIMRLIEMAVASLFTALVGNRLRPAGATIDNSVQAEVIRTPTIQTKTMPDATINMTDREAVKVEDEFIPGADLDPDNEFYDDSDPAQDRGGVETIRKDDQGEEG